MSTAPNTRGVAAWAALVFAAFALLFWTASHDAVRRPAWEIEVDQLDAGGKPRVRAFRDDQDQRLRTPPPLAAELSARVDGGTIEVVVPAAMRTTPSDWMLRLSFSDAARDAGVSGIRVEVDDGVIASDVEAERKRTLALPAAAFGDGPFRIRIAAPAAGALDGIRIRNHVSLRAWFPSFTLWRVERPWLRPLGDLGLFLLFSAGLGLGAFLIARWARRHGAAAWTERQARRLALPLATLAVACAGWNLLGSRPIVFGQGSLWLVFAGVALGVGVACARANVEAARTTPRSPAEEERFLDRRRALAIVLALFALYNSNGARVGMVDGYPPPQMAISLLKEGNLDLDEYRASYRDNQAGVGLVETAEHWVTRWAPGTALFCVPFFVVPVLLGVDAPSVGADMVTKFAMSLLTALSVGILFLALRRVASREAATGWAVAASSSPSSKAPPTTHPCSMPSGGAPSAGLSCAGRRAPSSRTGSFARPCFRARSPGTSWSWRIEGPRHCATCRPGRGWEWRAPAGARSFGPTARMPPSSRSTTARRRSPPSTRVRWMPWCSARWRPEGSGSPWMRPRSSIRRRGCRGLGRARRSW